MNLQTLAEFVVYYGCKLGENEDGKIVVYDKFGPRKDWWEGYFFGMARVVARYEFNDTMDDSTVLELCYKQHFAPKPAMRAADV